MKVSLTIIVVTVLALAGCGKDKANEQAATQKPATQTQPPATTTAVDTPATTVASIQEPVMTPTSPISSAPERIQFSKGTYGDTVGGSIRSGSVKDYILRARANQVMTISTKATEAPVYFAVIDDGEDISGATEEWSGTLASNGDYIVRVFLADTDTPGSASYTMSIEIR